MVERKYIKVRTDMYSDTKFKIIDTMEERDLIHYIWTRLLTLAGKVNLEGALYMSRNIPYTLETLAIEFNRSISKVKLALEAFKDLEMIELDENNVYKVKNFAKHQNIKSKKNAEKSENEDYKPKKIKDFKNNESEICKNDEITICKDFNEREVFKDSKNTLFKDDEGTIHEDNKRSICKDNNLYIKNEKENKAEPEEIRIKEQNKNLCKNKSKNDKYKVKEFKSISKKESYINNDIDKDNIEIEKSSIPLNQDKEFSKKESKKIDFNINLTCNNKKKKAKKSKKKSEDIEELCFEEDVIKQEEWSDEPILQGEVIKEFSF